MFLSERAIPFAIKARSPNKVAIFLQRYLPVGRIIRLFIHPRRLEDLCIEAIASLHSLLVTPLADAVEQIKGNDDSDNLCRHCID